MKIAPIVCVAFLCVVLFANEANSFVLTKKLVAVKAPIVAAKLKVAKDVKLKAAFVAKKAIGKAIKLKKKAAVIVATPIVAIKLLKKKLIAKKIAKIAGPIIALKALKKKISEKKLDKLHKIVPVAAGLGLGGLAATKNGLAFTEWNGVPFETTDSSAFTLIPEEYRSFSVEDSLAPSVVESYSGGGGFLRNTFAGVESGLATLGSSVPFLSTLTNGVSRPFSLIQKTVAPQPVYKFVPDLGFHKYQTVHYEPNIPVEIPGGEITTDVEVVPGPERPHETYGPPILPEIPEGPHETYGPPADTYDIPAARVQQFQIPSTSYGIPQGPSFRLNQQF